MPPTLELMAELILAAVAPFLPLAPWQEEQFCEYSEAAVVPVPAVVVGAGVVVAGAAVVGAGVVGAGVAVIGAGVVVVVVPVR